ncbi:MAG TPA: PQQ-dependent sugar dehydrogenase [bacterium]
MTRILRYALLSFAVALGMAGAAWAETAVTLQLVAEGVTQPVGMRESPDGSGRMFIVEQTGTIRILGKDGKLVADPFLDLRGKLVKQLGDFDERGLLSMAFHPNFKDNGKFYVYYDINVTKDAALPVKLWWSHHAILAEFTAKGNKADPASEREILRHDWPQFNHNGGDMHFGKDSMLYVSQGDGGFADDYGIGHNKVKGNGQDLSTYMGKILRIDVNAPKGYAIPKDNPFVGKKTKDKDVNGKDVDLDAREEIWAYGFRNPWRFSFDMGGKNELFVADVQQNSYEEVDIVVKGGNYGWRIMEGDHCFDWRYANAHPAGSCSSKGLVAPIMVYNNCNKFPKDCRGLSVTGGYVYRGKNKAWDGVYFFGDWSAQFGTKDGRIFAGKKGANGKWTQDDVKVTNMKFSNYVLAFAQDLSGEVYVLSTESTGPTGAAGKIYRIAQ